MSRFLFTRGLWLIFLELVPLRCLGFQFNFDYHVTMLFILWALGWAMIALAALVYLPTWLVTAFGAVMICTAIGNGVSGTGTATTGSPMKEIG